MHLFRTRRVILQTFQGDTNMKNKLAASLVMLVGIATVISVSAGTKDLRNKSVKDDINYQTVNVVVKSIIDQVLVGEDQVDWAYPKFDVNRSSIEQEKIYYTAEGAMKSVPWSKTDKPTVKAFSSYETDRVSPIQGIKVIGGTTAQVDLLSMARYGGKLALEKAQFSHDEYEDRFRAIVTRTSKVQTMDELYSLLIDSQALSIEIAKNEIKKQYDVIACIRRLECGVPTTDQWGNRTMDYQYAERISNYIQTIKRNLVSLEANKFEKIGTTITISNMSPQGFGADDNWNLDFVEAKSGVVIFTPSTINVTAEFFASCNRERLDDLKVDLKKRLKALSGHDSNEEAELQKSFRQGLIAFKNAINGNFH